MKKYTRTRRWAGDLSLDEEMPFSYIIPDEKINALIRGLEEARKALDRQIRESRRKKKKKTIKRDSEPRRKKSKHV